MGDKNLTNNFEVPAWAGKPPPGLHLDVVKDGSRIPKLMIDQKKCYFFGRNRELNDFHINHGSCSRVHSALIWHKVLNRPFLIDLGSTHGTYIGHIRLETWKPQQVPLDSTLTFGASTRKYIIRERPQSKPGTEEDGRDQENLLGLPETETELDNLTEFNTAHNRRIAAISDLVDMPRPKRKRKATHISFNDEDEVINPEDVDPSIGRFRNMVQTTVVKKKQRTESSATGEQLGVPQTRTTQPAHYATATDADESGYDASATLPYFSTAAKLGLRVPNLAPDVGPELDQMMDQVPPTLLPRRVRTQEPEAAVSAAAAPGVSAALEPKKKKYAKEAWPGKKPTPSLLV